MDDKLQKILVLFQTEQDALQKRGVDIRSKKIKLQEVSGRISQLEKDLQAREEVLYQYRMVPIILSC